MRFDARGEFDGTTKLRLAITVDSSGDSFTSRNLREDFDRNGALLNRIEATGGATRITAEPLD